jgi:hypothetical protein
MSAQSLALSWKVLLSYPADPPKMATVVPLMVDSSKIKLSLKVLPTNVASVKRPYTALPTVAPAYALMLRE